MQLINWGDDERSWPYDVFMHCVNEYPEEHIADAPKWIRNVFHILLFQGEVDNGGFNQYIFNSQGRWLDDLIEACENIGLQSLVPLIREGADAWLEKLKIESFRDQANGTIRGFHNANQMLDMRDLDHRFYLHERIIEEHLLEYVKAQKQQTA